MIAKVLPLPLLQSYSAVKPQILKFYDTLKPTKTLLFKAPYSDFLLQSPKNTLSRHKVYLYGYGLRGTSTGPTTPYYRTLGSV